MRNSTLLITSIYLVFMSSPLQADNSKSGIVKSMDIRLIEKTRFNKNEPLKKLFKDLEYEGWFNSEGEWNIKGTVAHGRLRCATYELGVQLGKGSPACLNIEWFTEISYGTRKEQCNSVTMTHSGGGQSEVFKSKIQEATCVKVVTRCTGTCGK